MGDAWDRVDAMSFIAPSGEVAEQLGVPPESHGTRISGGENRIVVGRVVAQFIW